MFFFFFFYPKKHHLSSAEKSCNFSYRKIYRRKTKYQCQFSIWQFLTVTVKWYIYYFGLSCNGWYWQVWLYNCACCWAVCLFGPVERGTKLQEQIVIGTPGTVLDWCQKLKFIDPKRIKVFVLDEADVMIATQGHQDQSIRIQRYVISLIDC